eukprot:gene29560-36629_t
MDAFKCLYDGVIPTDEIKPGDTLYSQNYFYVLELHADGNIVIMRNRDDNRQTKAPQWDSYTVATITSDILNFPTTAL